MTVLQNTAIDPDDVAAYWLDRVEEMVNDRVDCDGNPIEPDYEDGGGSIPAGNRRVRVVGSHSEIVFQWFEIGGAGSEGDYRLPLTFDAYETVKVGAPTFTGIPSLTNSGPPLADKGQSKSRAKVSATRTPTERPGVGQSISSEGTPALQLVRTTRKPSGSIGRRAALSRGLTSCCSAWLKRWKRPSPTFAKGLVSEMGWLTDLEDELSLELGAADGVQASDDRYGLVERSTGLVWSIDEGDEDEAGVWVRVGVVEGPGRERGTARVDWQWSGWIDRLVWAVAGSEAAVAAAVEEARRAIR